MSDMRRREFAALIGGVGLLLAVKVRRARGQQSAKIPRIGIIDDSPIWNAFRHGLRDLGYLEGGNIAFDYEYGDGVPERLAEAAAVLVRRPVDVIATYATPASFAAKQATTTIPIVMISIGDPVRAGLVPSLARPGGNITGNKISPAIPALARTSVPSGCSFSNWLFQPSRAWPFSGILTTHPMSFNSERHKLRHRS